MSLFNISAEQNFLVTLAKGIKEKFASEWMHNLTIILPTRRSCIKFAKIYIELNNGVAILPRTIPIGDIEKSDLLPKLEEIPPSLSRTEQLLLLSSIFDELAVAKSLDISQSMIKLLERLRKDEVELSKLASINFGDTAEHVSIMVEYLQKLSSKWPDILKKHDKLELTQRRNLYIDLLIGHWQDTPPENPVIIAGSTGSVKSTAKLIKAMANTENCYVILRGADLDRDKFSWQQIDYAHPLFYTKLLLDNLGVKSHQIGSWGQDQPMSIKTRFLQEVFRPTQTISGWQNLSQEEFSELDYISIVECQNQQEEALVIALKLREILEQGDQSVAVICNNGHLAAGIRSAMQRWNINIGSAIGKPLLKAPVVEFCKFVFDLIGEFTPLNLLLVLKHPFFMFGGDKKEVELIEAKFLRGVCSFATLDELCKIAKESNLLQRLAVAVKPLAELLLSPNIDFIKILTAHIQLIENLSDKEILWGSSSGKAVSEQLYEIIQNSNLCAKVSASEYWLVLSNLLQGRSYYDADDDGLPVAILTPIESRLLDFDYVIFADFVEGSQPEKPEIDPWFNHNICDTLGLTPSKYRLGQAAQDCYFLAHAKQVLITRSLRAGGSPTTSSRWLIRLETILAKIGKLNQAKPKLHYLNHWAKLLFNPTHIEKTELAASASPPLELRPKVFSVTSIERLMRDPYGYYASKILRLKPLDKIDKDPDQSDFGSFVHEVIDNFNKQYYKLKPEEYLSTLNVMAKEMLGHITNRPVIQQIWLPRFNEIAKWLIKFEEARRSIVGNKIHSEIKGEYSFNTLLGEFTITAKADRIEVCDNQVSIMDFKTGQSPTGKDILSGHSPQLTLEALIALKGKFDGVEKNLITKEMLYLILASGDRLGDVVPVNHDLEQLVLAAEIGVKNLLEYYHTENSAFVACPSEQHSPTYNEYAHLEREIGE